MLAVRRVDIGNYIFCKSVPVALKSDGTPSASAGAVPFYKPLTI